MGYANLRVNRKSIKAHRFSWELHNGPIPDGLKVLHKCDVRHCVNPDHLFLGTIKDNVDDMIQKGRKVILKGQDNPRAKLTNNQVLQIKEELKTEKRHADIAKEYGVSKSLVGMIHQNLIWRHVLCV